MAQLSLRQVSKSYGSAEILRAINLDIADGEFVVLVGPSGCGKSTLLRLIAGLDPLTEGTISIGNRVVNDLEPAQRKIAMVFQTYALYPHKNVRDNMTFGLKYAGLSPDEISRRVAEASRMLQLEDLLNRKPKELSGGQRQRVAIGRAIVREPDVFLFDEPLSNLDASLRVSTRVELARLHSILKSTMVYVTHDQIEAMTLADRIVVMNKGRIEQIGTPLELYYKPANLFVAGFIGSPKMNQFSAVLRGSDAATKFGLSVPLKTSDQSASFVIGIRPEHFTIGGSDQYAFPGRVDLVERLGEVSHLHMSFTSGETVIAEWRGRNAPSIGDKLSLHVDPSNLHIFDMVGNRIDVD
jgi:ABC-type sugar transport system ATPase subunit